MTTRRWDEAELDDHRGKRARGYVDRRALPPWPEEHPAPQLYTDPQKSLRWLARRTMLTASPAGPNVGLSPYRDAHPVRRYEIMTGAVADEFRGNDASRYGEQYEPRIRAIISAVLGVNIDEWGLFRDRLRRHLSVSPDGETPSLRFRGHDEHGVAFDWVLGKLVTEMKASPKHKYDTPRIPHITQTQLQLEVMRRTWGTLNYWRRDCVRVWLMRHDRYGFVRWMMRRLDLMYEHVMRRVPVTAENPYFAYILPPEARFPPFGRTVADWVAREWFDVDYVGDVHTIAGRRPVISMDEWRAELVSLGMSEEQWRARYPDTEAHAGDGGQLAVPPRPEIYQVYSFLREVPPEEDVFGDVDKVADHDPADRVWFEDEFPGITAGAEVNEAPEWPFTYVPRLFVEEVLLAPEHDEPRPVDQSAEDTPEERAEFERRLAELQAREDAPRLAEEARLAELASARVRDEERRAREAARAATLRFVAPPPISADLWGDD
jgi:hypothetical protein